MIKEHLEYWYDKDGNKVYGDKKKFNKCLVYLMDNDPKKVMSKTGLEIRKKLILFLENWLIYLLHQN
ncbi:MAG TPA: hypothetical protein IAB68_00825 [Candidatus Aphodocola excrementigallinarum]|uniref:Uncharacterized protein n=1 Tax=Candidatus Aphodocola excrementigallinarum TaxID=2840670 RepID=A0A9D1INH4_9FIRM|nr:hypothetical protein [Candidatus Aphodocola excrementigallinarum]